jgi:hypothetical protein
LDPKTDLARYIFYLNFGWGSISAIRKLLLNDFEFLEKQNWKKLGSFLELWYEFKAAIMTASVEKKAVSENNEPVADEKPQEEKKDTNSLTVEDIREHCKLIERSVVTKEARSIIS